MIQQYINNGLPPKGIKSGNHCDNQNKKIQVLDCFTIEREGEAEHYNPHNLSKKQLLWHSTGFFNFADILANGLKLPTDDYPLANAWQG